MYGNYHGYYGYRNQGCIVDPRIALIDPTILENKRILDIGCNSGEVTIQIAKLFHPSFIQGIDIDSYLVNQATQITRYQASLGLNEDFDYFPTSCPLTLGILPIIKCKNSDSLEHARFPHNIAFRCGDFALEALQIGVKYDTILALSLTKWIHLNLGDSGIKMFFQKCFASLVRGGCLILESQAFHTYAAKKAKYSTEMLRHLGEIELLPEMFENFLINVVGFRSCTFLGKPKHSAKNFCRDVYSFIK